LEVILKSITKLTILVLLASMLLVSCAQQANIPDTSPAQTSIAKTVVAMQTQISAAETQPAAATAMPIVEATTAPTAEPTVELVPTATTAATQIIQPTTIAASGTPYGPSYRVGHVKDLNYPDGTYFNPGLEFTKRWSITNIGTGTWTEDFKIVFVKGDQMRAETSIPLGRVYSPGQTMTIAIDMVAPGDVGDYQGYFMLQTADGVNFGIGPNFDQPFWVSIRVR
jgi:hypothetical protein